MYPEEYSHWGYQAYQNGNLLSEGANPIPDEVKSQMTEIRWVKHDPALTVIVPEPNLPLLPDPEPTPEPEPALEPLPEPSPGNGTTGQGQA